jgi:hypothetical protein
MKKLLILASILFSNSLISKSNYTIKFILNNKCTPESFIQINNLFTTTKSIISAKYRSTIIQRIDLPLSENFQKDNNLNYTSEVFSLGNINCLDSVSINKQYIDYYVSNINNSDKIFQYSSKENMIEIIENYIKQNKPKQKKLYAFTIFINIAPKCPPKPTFPCPKTIELINGEVLYIERCDRSNNAYFVFKWKSNSEIDLTKAKFNLLFRGKIIYSDTFNSSLSNFTKTGDTYTYFLSNEDVEYVIPAKTDNLSYYDAEFKWNIEIKCNNATYTRSPISNPFSFLKCPSKDETLQPCNE